MADYTPTLGDYTELKPFRFWCQKVLPLVYDDSLSYYELLCKVVDYLNKTMEDVDTLHTDVTNLHGAYVELQDYVNETFTELQNFINDYFDNLDVQQEIDNKLDAMAQDGSLSTLLAPFIPDIVSDWLSDHITPTTPAIDNTLTVSGAGADAKVTGDKINEINNTMNPLIDDVEDFGVPINAINYSDITDNYFVSSANGTLVANNSFKATGYIDLTGVEKIVVNSAIAQFAFYKGDKTYDSGVTINAGSVKEATVPNTAKYAKFSIEKSYGNGAVYLMTLDKYNNYNVKGIYDNLSEFEEKVLVSVPINVIDYTDITDNHFVASANGILVSNNSYKATGYIDLLERSKIVINNGIASQFAFYKSDKTFDSGVVIHETNPQEISVPNTAKYARFSIQKSIGDGEVYLMSFSEYQKNSVKYNTNIFNNFKTKVYKDVPVDVINPSEITDNYFVSSANGTLVANNSFNATDFIDLQDAEKIVVNKAIAQFAFYKEDKTYDSGVAIDAGSVKEATVPDTAKYARFSIQKSYGNGAVYLMSLKNYWNIINTPVVTIGSGEDFETLKDGIAYAITMPNTKVIIRKGTYNLINEYGSTFFENYGTTMGGGIFLKNGVKLYFEEGAKVTCFYTGNNENVMHYFSPFNHFGEWNQSNVLSEIEGFEIHNLNFEGQNTHYVIHDECGGKPVSYRDVYEHCEISFDAGAGNNGDSIIGGGLGQHGEIIIKDCIFNIVKRNSPQRAVSYHNNSYNGGNTTDLSSIVVSGCAFIGEENTLRLGYIGAATTPTKCIASANLFNAQPFVTAEQASAPIINMQLIEISNTINSN